MEPNDENEHPGLSIVKDVLDDVLPYEQFKSFLLQYAHMRLTTEWTEYFPNIYREIEFPTKYILPLLSQPVQTTRGFLIDYRRVIETGVLSLITSSGEGQLTHGPTSIELFYDKSMPERISMLFTMTFYPLYKKEAIIWNIYELVTRPNAAISILLTNKPELRFILLLKYGTLNEFKLLIYDLSKSDQNKYTLSLQGAYPSEFTM